MKVLERAARGPNGAVIFAEQSNAHGFGGFAPNIMNMTIKPAIDPDK